jgi:hypothetical protein
VHRRARRHVDGRRADLEPGVAQDLGRRIGVRLVQIGQHDMLTCAHPPRDRLVVNPADS